MNELEKPSPETGVEKDWYEIIEEKYANGFKSVSDATEAGDTTFVKSKPSNPKDAVGIKRVPFSTVPANVTAEVGLAMLEGALKYGRHNYRVIGVRASVYYDAALRHLTRWWEGEDIDPDSGLPHLVKALASLYVVRDSQHMGNLVDDRPPSSPEWCSRLNDMASDLVSAYPEPKQAFVREKDNG